MMIKVIFSVRDVKRIEEGINNIDDRKSGIYFLKYNSEIVYVGLSVDLKTRIYSHLKERVKAFNDFSIIECKEELLKSTEYAYIQLHEPIFNTRFANTESVDILDYCKDNNIPFEDFTEYDPKKIVGFSLDEETIESISTLVREIPTVANNSNLIITLVAEKMAKHKKAK